MHLNLSMAVYQCSSLGRFTLKITAEWQTAFAVQTRLIISVKELCKTHLAGTWIGSIERRQYQIEQNFGSNLIVVFQA